MPEGMAVGREGRCRAGGDGAGLKAIGTKKPWACSMHACCQFQRHTIDVVQLQHTTASILPANMVSFLTYQQPLSLFVVGGTGL